ncbi:MAG: response regulator transcription factor [Flavobacteriaceae bacterium]|nr:response regulator transcription factor [Flavobacteriaceae bacterium]
MLLKGLSDVLTKERYPILESALNGLDAVDIILKHCPVIAILDIEMPELSGFEVIKKCSDYNCKTKFIILTSHREKAFIQKARDLNISGYLLKDEPFDEIEACILAVAAGGQYFSRSFNEVFQKEISPLLERIQFLSPSERKIVQLISKVKTSKEIGEILNISYRTVQKHRANVISKLMLPSGRDILMTWAIENREFLSTL